VWKASSMEICRHGLDFYGVLVGPCTSSLPLLNGKRACWVEYTSGLEVRQPKSETPLAYWHMRRILLRVGSPAAHHDGHGRTHMYFSPSLRSQRANSASVPIRAISTFVPLKP
jgi:hypothetical protein